jgi:hypothetical protein
MEVNAGGQHFKATWNVSANTKISICSLKQTLIKGKACLMIVFHVHLMAYHGWQVPPVDMLPGLSASSPN